MHGQRLRATRTAVAGLAALTLLAGCTGSGEEPAADPSPASPTAAPESGPVALRLGLSGSPGLQQAFADVVEAFEDTAPGVSIELEQLPAGGATAEALAGAGRADLFVTDAEQAPAMVEAEVVQPVDELLAERGVLFGDDYQRLALEAFSAEQALQCMPYDVSPLMVFYNRDLVPLDEVSEPGETPPSPEEGWTWDQFARAAALASEGRVKGAHVEPEMRTLLALVRTAGEDLVDDPREPTTTTFSDAGTRLAIEEILAVVRDPDLTPTEAQIAAKDGLSRFAEGQVAMVVGTRAIVPQLRQAEDLDFDVLPLPRLARAGTVATVDGVCLSADSEHPGPAADFLAFLSGPEGTRLLARTGEVVPIYLPTLKSEAFLQSSEQPAGAVAFDASLRRATTVPFDVGWPDLVRSLEDELDALFYDLLVDLDAVLPRIDEDSTAYLDTGTDPDEPDEQPEESDSAS